MYARGSRKNPASIPAVGIALDVKQAHCALVDDRHGLATFIDDEPDIIAALQAAGHPALHTSDLTNATTRFLRQLTQHRRCTASAVQELV